MAVERTLAIIKSGAFARGQALDILARASRSGLSIAAMRQEMWSADAAGHFYQEHEGRPHYERLVRSVTDHPVVFAVLEGDNAIARWRRLLGPTDPAQAPEGTIRGDFGTVLPDNAAHGSDSSESAAREIELVFPELALRPLTTVSIQIDGVLMGVVGDRRRAVLSLLDTYKDALGHKPEKSGTVRQDEFRMRRFFEQNRLVVTLTTHNMDAGPEQETQIMSEEVGLHGTPDPAYAIHLGFVACSASNSNPDNLTHAAEKAEAWFRDAWNRIGQRYDRFMTRWAEEYLISMWSRMYPDLMSNYARREDGDIVRFVYDETLRRLKAAKAA